MTYVASTHDARASDPAIDSVVRRRVGWVWALLFFNVLTGGPSTTLISIPHGFEKLLTQASLWIALVLALSVNRRIVLRRNAFLSLATLLAALSLTMSLGMVFGFGSVYRAARLVGFIAALWLLTPWWGRRDLFIVRLQLRCLLAVVALSVVGLALAPHKALEAGRLQGIVWPMQTTQLAHCAAVAAGIAAVLWLSEAMGWRLAVAIVVPCTTVLLMTHTRTAMVALLSGLVVAVFELFFRRRRARRTLAVISACAVVAVLVLSPALSHWFTRGQSSTSFAQLSGRTVVWSQLLRAPTPTVQRWLGSGLSNNSFNGAPIDNSWLAAYQDQGIVGDAVIGLMLLSILLGAVMRPRAPGRALALFVLTFCVISSFTEVGLGDASIYFLDLTAVATALVPPLAYRASPKRAAAT